VKEGRVLRPEQFARASSGSIPVRATCVNNEATAGLFQTRRRGKSVGLQGLIPPTRAVAGGGRNSSIACQPEPEAAINSVLSHTGPSLMHCVASLDTGEHLSVPTRRFASAGESLPVKATQLAHTNPSATRDTNPRTQQLHELPAS
jgi:hypothetical protein